MAQTLFPDKTNHKLMKQNSPNRKNQSIKSRILFVNRFYAPDTSATSQILTDVAESLAERGHQIVVFTSRGSYDGQNVTDVSHHNNGVQVRRIWSTQFGRHSNSGRILDYLTFYISMSVALIRNAAKSDIIVAKTDPPMLSIPLGIIARVKRVKLVNWLQDIFPEVAIKLGYGSSKNLLMRFLIALRNRSLRRAQMNIVIGRRMSDRLSSVDVPAHRICIIENFADDVSIQRSTEHSLDLRKEWGILETDFVVGYSGNLGRAHDIDTILDTAESLKEHTDVKFLFIGGGIRYDRLVQQAEARKISSFRFKPYQSRTQLRKSLTLPNLHWASLTPSLEGYIVPSKVYGIAAAGRPLMMIGDPKGEIAQILDEYQFGACIPIGESASAKDLILQLRSDSQLEQTMGHHARVFIDRRASRQQAVERWDELIRELAMD